MRNILRHIFKKKDKRLGIAQSRRQYDLPLNNDAGTGFLILLITLMAFLAVMALAASFALGSMTSHWSSGLENKLTIEIPAEKSDGNLRTSANIDDLKDKIAARLQKNTHVKDFEILEDQEIQDLISPWLGSDLIIQDIPLPGLISVELHSSTNDVLNKLSQDILALNTDIRIDTHESWLGNLLRLTGALQFAAAFIAAIIGATTITAVAGAVRSRMAVHKEDVELLHLMGASDEYITKQFQRHATSIALKGSLVGVIIGTAILLSIALISGDTTAALLPSFKINFLHVLSVMAVPAVACLIAGTSARYTVLRDLAVMP